MPLLDIIARLRKGRVQDAPQPTQVRRVIRMPQRIPPEPTTVSRQSAWDLYEHLNEHPSPSTETQMRQEYRDWFAIFDAERLASSDCPRCGAALVETTNLGDYEPSFLCQNGHWFYGKERTDGIEMFGDVPRDTIMRELNEAIASARQYRAPFRAFLYLNEGTEIPVHLVRDADIDQTYTGMTQRLTRHCTVCGDELPQDAAYCIGCGMAVDRMVFE